MYIVSYFYYNNKFLKMKKLEVKFDKSISIDSKIIFHESKKQVIFVWRSNVWKSSLMNAIFEKKDLVKTSSMPGKTKLANLFLVNNKFHFVDMPGYWFAKLWQEQKEKLDSLISWYIEEFKPYIKKIIIVLDSKIWPTQKDIDMFKFLQEFEIPLIFVLNKIDKLSNNEINKSLNYTSKAFFWQQILTSSTKNFDGINDIKKELIRVLS